MLIILAGKAKQFTFYTYLMRIDLFKYLLYYGNDTVLNVKSTTDVIYQDTKAAS